jgi:hypothetical protein
MPNYDGTGPLGNGTTGRGLGPCGTDRTTDAAVGGYGPTWSIRDPGLGLRFGLALGSRLRGHKRATAWSAAGQDGATSLRTQFAALEKALARVTALMQQLV